MDLVAYDEPPKVRSQGSCSSSIASTAGDSCPTSNGSDSGRSLDHRASRAKVHFGHVNVNFVDSSLNLTNINGAAVTGRDGASLTVDEHIIKCEQRKRKRKRAQISSRGDGPWPVVDQSATTPPRTVREKYLKMYIILSVIACVLFFPTGIPALVFSLKTRRLFYSGMQAHGEVSADAIKASRICERLLIISIVCVILYAMVLFAVIEKMLKK